MADELPLDVELKVEARAENVAIVRRALTAMAEGMGADEVLVGDMKTAVTEACMNVVVHAYPNGDEPGILEVTAEAGDRRIAVCVRDYGGGIHPRPLEDDGRGMRLGLPLISALADEFEINGGSGRGTEVRIAFEFDRPRSLEAGVAPDAPSVKSGETLVTIRSDGAGPAAIGAVATLAAARSDLSVDRVSEVGIVADLLADLVGRSEEERPVAVSVGRRDGGLELRLGPLSPGAAERMLDGGVLPGLGNTLERLADEVAVEERADGQGVLQLRFTRA